jgi:hypothetical protein
MCFFSVMVNVDISILYFRYRQVLFCGKQLLFQQKVFFNSNFQNDGFTLVVFRGRRFQQTVDIPMGSNCVPFLIDFYSNQMKRTSYRCYHRERRQTGSIYSNVLEIKDKTHSKVCLYMDHYLETDDEDQSK